MEFRACSRQENLMTRVKICGITNLEDALVSAKFGADALGFNFYEKSPRYIAPEKAREIIEHLPANILKVGVFVNEDLGKIAEIAETARLDTLQLHGEETPEFAHELKAKTGLEIIKAFRVTEKFNPLETLYYEYDTILLDAFSMAGHGGTGEKFDWWIAIATKKIFPKMYLAGGITPANVLDAIQIVKPYGIDVCSGVEKTKGIKDESSVRNFIDSVRVWEKDKIENFYQLLKSIEKKPKSYFESKSLTSMWIFIDGFQSAIKWTDTDFNLLWFEMINSNSFINFVREKLGIKSTEETNWVNLILNNFGGDEEKSFDCFFSILEEFRNKFPFPEQLD